MTTTKSCLISVSVIAATFVSFPLSVGAQSSEPLIELTIDAPGGSILSADAKIKDGKVKDKDANVPDLPTLFEEDWTMTLRLAAPESVAVFRWRERLGPAGINFETLVLDDPDGCLDMRGAQQQLTAWFPGPDYASFEGCDGPDETFINFGVDEFDFPGLADTQGSNAFDNDADTLCGGPVIGPALGDDPYTTTDFANSNKAYVETTRPPAASFPRGAGAYTGGEATGFSDYDCYGYGADENLPSLVIMSNTAGARIFNPVTLEYSADRIRNMAGLISGVSFELFDNGDASVVSAQMHVRSGTFQPLTFVDLNYEFFGGDPIPDPLVVLTKVEDAPIETTELTGITTSNLEDVINAVKAKLPTDYEVEIRAVVVDGIAPNFIDDLNGDGAFTAADLELAGYSLLSNEAIQRVNLINYNAIASEEDELECPLTRRSLNYVDLDGNGVRGSCADGDGTSRSGVRRPR